MMAHILPREEGRVFDSEGRERKEEEEDERHNLFSLYIFELLENAL
jgi:hypothetical protein